MLTAPDMPSAKLVVVIDDDPMVLEGMSGLLRSWGYQVLTAATEDAALASLAAQGRRPDLIVCDYRLAGDAVVFRPSRLRAALRFQP